MFRTLLTLVVFVAALSGVNGASAQTCFCIVNEDGATGISERNLGAAEANAPFSVEVGPLFSSDGLLLSSQLRSAQLRGSDFGVAAQQPAPTEVLWCSNSADPRCAPAPHPVETQIQLSYDSQHAHHLQSNGHRTTATAEPQVSFGRLVGPSKEIRNALERPPRS